MPRIAQGQSLSAAGDGDDIVIRDRARVGLLATALSRMTWILERTNEECMQLL